jgi:hypothetical protein
VAITAVSHDMSAQFPPHRSNGVTCLDDLAHHVLD